MLRNFNRVNPAQHLETDAATDDTGSITDKKHALESEAEAPGDLGRFGLASFVGVANREHLLQIELVSFGARPARAGVIDTPSSVHHRQSRLIAFDSEFRHRRALSGAEFHIRII